MALGRDECRDREREGEPRASTERSWVEMTSGHPQAPGLSDSLGKPSLFLTTPPQRLPQVVLSALTEGA